MVDGVELAAIDHVLDVRHFDDHYSVIFDKGREPTHYPVKIRDVREHVVGVNDVSLHALPAKVQGEVFVEEVGQRRNAALAASNLGDVDRRLDAENGNSRLLVVLKQVAVVTGDLDDETVGTQPTRNDKLAGECLSMAQHRVRERREV